MIMISSWGIVFGTILDMHYGNVRHCEKERWLKAFGLFPEWQEDLVFNADRLDRHSCFTPLVFRSHSADAVIPCNLKRLLDASHYRSRQALGHLARGYLWVRLWTLGIEPRTYWLGIPFSLKPFLQRFWFLSPTPTYYLQKTPWCLIPTGTFWFSVSSSPSYISVLKVLNIKYDRQVIDFRFVDIFVEVRCSSGSFVGPYTRL